MYVSVCVRVVCMRYLQVYVAETLVHTVAFPHLNLQQVIDQVNCCEHKIYTSSLQTSTWLFPLNESGSGYSCGRNKE